MDPAIAGLEALAGCSEGIFGIGKRHHGLGALGHQRRDHIAQQCRLAGAGRAVDRENLAFALCRRQVDRSLLHQHEGMASRSRPAARRKARGRDHHLNRFSVAEQIAARCGRENPQIALEDIGRIAPTHECIGSRQILKVETVEQNRFGGIARLEANHAADCEGWWFHERSVDPEALDEPVMRGADAGNG